MKNIVWYIGLGVAIALPGCSPRARPHTYEKFFPTRDVTITIQGKKTYQFGADDVAASNQFDGARLNDFTKVNDSVYRAEILPENEPINPSPWYAFKIWSKKENDIYLELDYGKYKHRYRPQVSGDGIQWTLLDSTQVIYKGDSQVVLKLSIGPDTLWLAGQEVISSQKVMQWCIEKARGDAVTLRNIGVSKLGRDIPLLDIGSGSPKGKPVVIVLGRQHPPEVTGYFAMQHFIERILGQDSLATAFRNKFRVMTFPLLNPDGVDMGHWRHNAGGVDLNRDWATYEQPETRVVANYIVKQTQRDDNTILLGLDFHSTYHDVYYTLDHTRAPSLLPNFTKQWFNELERQIPGYIINEDASGLTRPVAKNWFNAQFKAEGITYEIGDETEREFIKEKGHVSAEVMMELLLERSL